MLIDHVHWSLFFFFSCLKGYGFVSHRWPAGFGCVLGINLVIGYDLAGIIFHSIKVPPELFFLIVTCITIVSVPALLRVRGQLVRVSPSTLRIWEIEYNCPSGLATSAFTHTAIFSARVLSCGIVSVCLLLLPALWVSSKKSSPDPMS